VKLLILFITLFSFNAFSNVELRLSTTHSSIKQGEIAEVVVHIQSSRGEIPLKGLVGKHFAETIYFYSMDPFVIKNGLMESRAKIIFTKNPQSDSLQEEIEGVVYHLKWPGIQIIPTAQSEGFKFGNFDIPYSLPWLMIIVILFIFVPFCIYSFKLLNSYKLKNQHKRHLTGLITELESAKDYNDVERIWLKREEYISAFPQIENDFRKFEEILNRHQFKRSRKDADLNEIIEAYERFKSQLIGVKNGI
jgi:hypothetical protein